LLRSSGLACSAAYKGSVKRRAEIAKKEGATVRLLIRSTADPMGRLHISHFANELSNEQQTDLDRKISRALDDHFGSTLSSSGWNRPNQI
jgi:hypothetical protein